MGADGRVDAAAVVVAGVVVLSGCSVFAPAASGPERTDTVTPVPLETESTPSTPTASPWHVPGVEGTTITDLDALLRSHERHLANRSYTLTWSRRTTGGPARVASVFEYEVAIENETTYRKRSVGSDDPGVAQTYADPGGLYRRVNRTGEPNLTVTTAFERFSTPQRRFAALPGRLADTLVDPAAAEVALVTRNGTRYARLTSRSTPESIFSIGVVDALEAFSVTVWVHPDGYLRSLSYAFTFRQGGEPTTVAVRYDYTDVGETDVSKPAWVRQFEADRDATPPGNATRTPAGGATSTGRTATPTRGPRVPPET